MSGPTARPPGVVSVERVRGERPEEEDWRADGFSQSRHSRLLDELRQPLEDFDEARAERLCARICREALRDFAPALLLLPGAERRRVQVLTAFTLTLFDFARQTGLEGDRLSEINRWEFGLDQALEGEPPGQPIFVLMAREELRRPWPRRGLDGLLSAARRHALTGRADDAAAARQVAHTLLGDEPTERLVAELAALLRVGRLARPGSADRSGEGATKEELREIAKLLEGPPAIDSGPWRHVVRYLRIAGRSLAMTMAATTAVAEPRRSASGPRSGVKLGLLARLGALFRARFF